MRRGFNITDGPIDTHEELMSKLRSLIPGVVTEDGKIDVVALRKLVGKEYVTDSNHRHELKFAGKGVANYLADSHTDMELKVERGQSKDFDSTQNVVIRGDNLDVLKTLRKNYYNSVKVIYIDPPYNTGNDGFVYKDDFKKSDKQLIEDLGLTEETVERFQDLYGTKTHSGWLAFMYSRLKVARDLLADDGVIFISIDDNEQANLRNICDEMFGEGNFITNFVWRSRLGRGATSKKTSTLHEYVIAYGKNTNLTKFKTDKRVLEKTSKERLRQWGQGDRREDRPTMYYPVQSKEFGEIYPKRPDGSDGRWRVSQYTMNDLLEHGLVVFEERTHGVEAYRIKPAGSETQTAYPSMFDDNVVKTTAYGSIELKDLMKTEVFLYPKPSTLIKEIISLCTSSTDIILDFFAGSGTTGEAVMRLNIEDGGNRKFILVQIDEEIKQDQREAIEFCKKNQLEPVISSITLERLNRAGDTIKKEHPDTDVGYKVFRLKHKPKIESDGSQDILFSIQHTKRDASDTLYNMLCATGKPLDIPIKTMVEGKLYEAGGEMYVLGDVDISNYKDRRINVDGWSDDITLEQYLNLPRSNVEVVY